MRQTSERIIEPDTAGTAVGELHMAAYRWASGYSTGRRVLDYGCGTGYGARFLSATAAHVTGYDIDPAAIDYASEHYGRPGVEYTTERPANAAYDLVVSFQVIEHVDADEHLADIARALRPGGILLLTTPNRSVRLWRFQKPWNRWHLTEYDRAGLTRLLARHFTHVERWAFDCSTDIEESELRRYRWMRTVLLPATLIPWYPARFHLLNVIASIAAAGVGSAATDGSVSIVRNAPDSVCLAALVVR